jgi:phosphate transport system substrate-binding protein
MTTLSISRRRVVLPALAASAAAVAVAVAAVLLQTRPLQAQPSALRVGGSTTLVPAIANAASQFMQSHKGWNEIDPGLPRSRIVIYVTGGGSGFGIRSTIEGTVDIGLVSRDLKDGEKQLLGRHRSWLVGKDAVSIAANVDNPLARARKSLSQQDARRIFSGQVRTYRDLDGALPAQPIVLLVRDASAGSAEIFQEHIMGPAQVSQGALNFPSQGALIKKLESNPNAIAYASSGLVSENKRLHAFALNGVEPTAANVLAGAYPLTRPLLMIARGEPPSPTVKAFADFVLGPGQAAVLAQGYVPIRRQPAGQ